VVGSSREGIVDSHTVPEEVAGIVVVVDMRLEVEMRWEGVGQLARGRRRFLLGSGSWSGGRRVSGRVGQKRRMGLGGLQIHIRQCDVSVSVVWTCM
jgi:hypothetical protein